MSCCGIQEIVSRIQEDALGNPIIDEADFVMVRYVGGLRQARQVVSPTQVLRTEYGYQKNHYGQHRHGDVFAIHRADLEARPDLFEEVVEDEAEPPAEEPETKADGAAEKPEPHAQTESVEKKAEAESATDSSATKKKATRQSSKK